MVEHIQSIIFDKKDWNYKNAEIWVEEHGYIPVFKGKEYDETKHKYRFRQINPNYKKYFYRIKHLPENIDFILGYPKKEIETFKYDEAKKVANSIKQKFMEKYNIPLEIVGSLYRGDKDIKDIDFVTYKPLPNDKKYIRSNYDNIKFDIWYIPKKYYKLGKILRCYRSHVVIALRKGLKKKGWTLTDKALLNEKGDEVKKTIQQIFKIANVEYKEP